MVWYLYQDALDSLNRVPVQRLVRPKCPPIQQNSSVDIINVSIGNTTNGVQPQVFTQSVPANVWTINHNMGMIPSVTLTDLSGKEIFGEVLFTSVNQIIVSVRPSTTGRAYLNP